MDLSSQRAHSFLRTHGLGATRIDAVVLIEGDRAYIGSSAALRIAGKLGPPWSLLRALLLIPGALREPAYRFTARNRHRFFAQRACPEPHPRLCERTLT